MSPAAHGDGGRVTWVNSQWKVCCYLGHFRVEIYSQTYSRWVEAEEKLSNTPMLLKTPSGYVQQSPWLTVANKQMELMARYMGELGLTPVARARLDIGQSSPADMVTTIEFATVYTDKEGNRCEQPLDHPKWQDGYDKSELKTVTYELN